MSLCGTSPLFVPTTINAQIRNIDAVDVAATNISCTNLTVGGEPISTVLQNLGESTPGTTVFAGNVTADSLTTSGALNALSITSQTINAGVLTASSLTATGSLSALSIGVSGAVTAASVAATGAVTGASMTATGQITANIFAGTMTTGTQNSITKIGTQTSLASSGNITQSAGTTSLQATTVASLATTGNITQTGAGVASLGTTTSAGFRTTAKTWQSGYMMTDGPGGTILSNFWHDGVVGTIACPVGALSISQNGVSKIWISNSNVEVTSNLQTSNNITQTGSGITTLRATNATNIAIGNATTQAADTELLRLNMDGARNWVFEQSSSGPDAGLRLRPLVDGKTFSISDPLRSDLFDVGANGEINHRIPTRMASVNIDGNADITGALVVTGNTSLTSLQTSGNTTVNGSLQVTGNAIFSGSVSSSLGSFTVWNSVTATASGNNSVLTFPRPPLVIKLVVRDISCATWVAGDVPELLFTSSNPGTATTTGSTVGNAGQAVKMWSLGVVPLFNGWSAASQNTRATVDICNAGGSKYMVSGNSSRVDGTTTTLSTSYQWSDLAGDFNAGTGNRLSSLTIYFANKATTINRADDISCMYLS